MLCPAPEGRGGIIMHSLINMIVAMVDVEA